MELNLKWELNPWQASALRDTHRFAVLVWHRKARKTTTALMKIIMEALKHPGLYWMIEPSYRQAKEVLWDDPLMLFHYLPEELIQDKNKMDLTVYLKNKSAIALKGGDRPDMLRGGNPKGQIVDEYSIQKREIWEQVVAPIVRASGGWTWFLFTPKGRNHAFELWEGVKDNPEWTRSFKTIHDTNMLSPHEIEEAKKTMRELSFRQEFLCEFLESGGEFFRKVDEAIKGELENPQVGKNYIVGVDVAKYIDWTVISVWDRSNNHLVAYDRYQKIDWVLNRRRIKRMYEKYPGILVIEANSQGDPVIDELRYEGISVEPIITTERTKYDMLDKLAKYIENGYLTYPAVPQFIDELKAFGYQFGVDKYGNLTGKMKLSAPSWSTDDFVMSAALACSQMYPPLGGETRDELKQYDDF